MNLGLILFVVLVVVFFSKWFKRERRETDDAQLLQRIQAEQANPPASPSLPVKIGTHALQYQYTFAFDLLPDATRPDPSEEITVSADSMKIYLAKGDAVFGEILDPRKAEMVRDFQRCSRPVLAVVESDGLHVRMGFYRDKRIGNEWREQVVIPLMPYTDAQAQAALSSADPDEELSWGDYSASYDPQDVRIGEIKIGRLPDEMAKRYPYLIYLERIEKDEDRKFGTVYIPYVRLYFDHPNT